LRIRFATRLVGMTDWAAVAIDFRNVLQALKTIGADGVQVFYREAGPADGPVLLLLHGYPTSSFMFRESTPRMASRYRVIAPDLPGLGFTEVSKSRGYRYSFESIANTIVRPDGV
jgi:pimeloyl-ACP methyl ester carboxylesterase